MLRHHRVMQGQSRVTIAVQLQEIRYDHRYSRPYLAR
jgi:hypothetical protein